MKTMLATAAATAALFVGISAAQAQAPMVEIDDSVQVDLFGLTADQVSDLDVYTGNQKIGDVEEVIGTDARTPAALVIDFDDDATYGSGERIVPLNQLGYSTGQVTLDLSAEDIAALQPYND